VYLYRRLSTPIMDSRKAPESKLLSVLQYGSIDEDMCSEEDRFGPIRTLLSLSGTNQGTNTEHILGNLGNRKDFNGLYLIVVSYLVREINTF